jgi:hypothetical protein
MFQVGNFVPWLSDHSPIYADIKLNLERKPPEAPINLKKREAGFVWNDGCEENFKELLAKQNIKIEHANLEAVRNSDANKLADEIKKSLIEASKGCNLKKRKHRKTENTKPWFDNECKEIKKNVTEIGKKLRANHGNKELRTELYNLKRTLKNTVRKKKRMHKKLF